MEILTELSKEARRKGLLALEAKAAEIEDEFLRKRVFCGLSMPLNLINCVPGLIRKLIILLSEMIRNEKIYDMGAALGPAFGMIGTLIGLVNMLKNMSFEGGASTLGADMSVALITTFYGSVLANTIFMPMSSKLQIAQNRDLLIQRVNH